MVSNRISVKVRDLKKTGKLLTPALGSGKVDSGHVVMRLVHLVRAQKNPFGRDLATRVFIDHICLTFQTAIGRSKYRSGDAALLSTRHGVAMIGNTIRRQKIGGRVLGRQLPGAVPALSQKAACQTR